MKPELVFAVRLLNRGGRAAVAPVTAGAAELFRVVNLEYVGVWMADEGARKHVGATSPLRRHHVGGTNRNGGANAEVTRLAAVNNHVAVDVYLAHAEVELVEPGK